MNADDALPQCRLCDAGRPHLREMCLTDTDGRLFQKWRREFLDGHVSGENEDHRLAGIIADQADELDRLRAAVFTQEADTALTYADARLPLAVNPDGIPVDHDCDFRRMMRDIAEDLGVAKLPSGNYRAEDIAVALQAALSSGGTEPAVEVEQLRWERDVALSRVAAAEAVQGRMADSLPDGGPVGSWSERDRAVRDYEGELSAALAADAVELRPVPAGRETTGHLQRSVWKGPDGKDQHGPWEPCPTCGGPAPAVPDTAEPPTPAAAMAMVRRAADAANGQQFYEVERGLRTAELWMERNDELAAAIARSLSTEETRTDG